MLDLFFNKVICEGTLELHIRTAKNFFMGRKTGEVIPLDKFLESDISNIDKFAILGYLHKICGVSITEFMLDNLKCIYNTKDHSRKEEINFLKRYFIFKETPAPSNMMEECKEYLEKTRQGFLIDTPTEEELKEVSLMEKLLATFMCMNKEKGQEYLYQITTDKQTLLCTLAVLVGDTSLVEGLEDAFVEFVGKGTEGVSICHPLKETLWEGIEDKLSVVSSVLLAGYILKEPEEIKKVCCKRMQIVEEFSFYTVFLALYVKHTSKEEQNILLKSYKSFPACISGCTECVYYMHLVSIIKEHPEREDLKQEFFESVSLNSNPESCCVLYLAAVLDILI